MRLRCAMRRNRGSRQDHPLRTLWARLDLLFGLLVLYSLQNSYLCMESSGEGPPASTKFQVPFVPLELSFFPRFAVVSASLEAAQGGPTSLAMWLVPLLIWRWVPGTTPGYHSPLLGWIPLLPDPLSSCLPSQVS